ncbi:hypothetical protein, partial [Streptomyces sodiiphilus]|uniref:hypothetical protein n=1 Tax=Streptomyces sodiiphilus TaxID=226217 RepID=UPI0031D176EC
MHVQLRGIVDCVHEVDDELAHFLGRQVPGPREDLWQGAQNRAGTLIAADQGREQLGGAVGGLLTLTVMTLGGAVQILAVAARHVDTLRAVDGVGDALGALRQIGERNGRSGHTWRLVRNVFRSQVRVAGVSHGQSEWPARRRSRTCGCAGLRRQGADEPA